MSDSGEFQDLEIICSGKLSHVSKSIDNCSKFLWCAEPRPKSAIWCMEFAWSIGKRFFGSPHAVIDSSWTRYQGMLHSWNQSATGGNPVRDSTGKLVARSEERIERLFQRRDLQGNNEPSILSFQQKEHIHRFPWLINKDFRSRSFNMTNSAHPQRLHVGRYDSSPK